MPKIMEADINARLTELGASKSQISSMSVAVTVAAWDVLRKERADEAIALLNERYVVSQEAIAAADTRFVAGAASVKA